MKTKEKNEEEEKKQSPAATTKLGPFQDWIRQTRLSPNCQGKIWEKNIVVVYE